MNQHPNHPARDRVKRWFEGLEQHERLVLLLRWADGLSLAETASVMGVSFVTVERDLARLEAECRVIAGPDLARLGRERLGADDAAA